MKIAMIVNGGLHPSGEEQVVPSWLAVFEQLGKSHSVHAFALRHLPDAQSYALRNFTVHDLGRPSGAWGFGRAAQEKALASALAAHGPFDIIHGFFADPAGYLAARAGRTLGIPSVVTCDSGEFVSVPAIKYGSQRSWIGRRVVREACTLATRVHVCTQFMSALAEAHGVHSTVIPLTSVTPAAAAVKWLPTRREHHTFRLIQVATLSRVKNQVLAIDALRLVREHADARLDLVGEDTLRGAVQQHATSLGLADAVTFHGFQPQARVHELLSAADLYVQSSLHEAAGVSVLEAAAHGVPTVGTLAGYVADWSPTKAEGIRDAIPDSLADAILGLHRDDDRRRSMAALARTYSVANDAAWSASQFDAMYRELV